MKWWTIFLGVTSIIALAGISFLVLRSGAPENAPTPKRQLVETVQTSANLPADTTNNLPVTLTFVGDIMLDRYVRTTIEKNSPAWPFEKITPQLTGDIVIGNLEGPITSQPSVATDTNLVFTFDPAHTSGLTTAGFTHLSLANNHTLNFGETGLANTREILAQNFLQFFGDPKNRAGYIRTEVINEKTVSFVGYHGLVSGLTDVIEEVRSAKASGSLVVVMAHWGNEYQASPSAKQRDDAHALIDAGADVIIGAHPHVIQPLEIYQEKIIAYSLGNFLFDQYFSTETLQGLLVRITFGSTTTVNLLPVVTAAGQISVAEEKTRDVILTQLEQTSIFPEYIKSQIRTGRIVLHSSL